MTTQTEAIADFRVDRRPIRATSSRERRARSFSTDEIIQAIRQWTARYGEPPTTTDWEPARARRLGQSWRADRFESERWPSARMVRRQFPTFNAAIEAAGLVPRPAPSRQRANLSGPEAITAAMIEWTRRYGDVPTMADWDPVRARRLGQDWRIARYNTGDWPSARTVALHFGSFAKAALAAGLVPRERSTHHDRREAQQAANRQAAARASGAAGRPGLANLAASLRALAQARCEQDPVSIHAALIDVAGSALAWAHILGAD
jgi:Homing endonuclease associated repeat